MYAEWSYLNAFINEFTTSSDAMSLGTIEDILRLYLRGDPKTTLLLQYAARVHGGVDGKSHLAFSFSPKAQTLLMTSFLSYLFFPTRNDTNSQHFVA